MGRSGWHTFGHWGGVGRGKVGVTFDEKWCPTLTRYKCENLRIVCVKFKFARREFM